MFPPECVSCVPRKGNQNMLISLVFYFIAGNPKFVAGAHIGKVSARLKLCNEQNFGKKLHRVVGPKVELGQKTYFWRVVIA